MNVHKGRQLLQCSIIVALALQLFVIQNAVIVPPATVSATSVPAVGWNAASVYDPTSNNNELLRISCVSTSDCWGVGVYEPSTTYWQPLIQQYNGSSWSEVTSPVKTSTAVDVLNNVTCLTSSDCWADGYYENSSSVIQPLIEQYNGTSWSIASDPSESTTTYLYGLACVSTSDCWAVGFQNDSSGYGQPFTDVYNGTSWTTGIAESTSTTESNWFNSVSCTSSSFCSAAGFYQNSSGDNLTLIEKWNGTSWAIQTSPNVSGMLKNQLNGVTCLTSSNCWAAGYTETSSSIYQNLIEQYNGSTWSIVTVANDADDDLTSVTCVSSMECWAAGTVFTDGYNQTLMLQWDGTSWSIASTYNTSTTEDNTLSDVYCLSANFCWTSGHYVASSTLEQALGEVYGGPVQDAPAATQSWLAAGAVGDGSASSPSVSSSDAAAPVNTQSGELYQNATDINIPGRGFNLDVSRAYNSIESVDESVIYGSYCVSSSDCWAVGYSCTVGECTGYEQTLIEQWDGTTWNIVPSPDQSTLDNNNVLDNVTCTSSSHCFAVGYYCTSSDGGRCTEGSYDQTLIEQWNGTSWSIVSSPDQGSVFNALNDVTCLTSTNCWTVGLYLSGVDSQTLTEQYNGTSWSIVSSANGTDNDLRSISCLSSSDCWSVGTKWVSTNETFSEQYNGSSWAIVSTPNVNTSYPEILQSVSCVSSTDCWAAGYSTTSSSVSQTLTEQYNGTSWSIVSSYQASSTASTQLSSITCLSTTNCWAVGYYTDTSGYLQALSERYNGTSWSSGIAESYSSTVANYLFTISCVSSSDCWSLGYYGNSANLAVLLAESYDGTSWSIPSGSGIPPGGVTNAGTGPFGYGWTSNLGASLVENSPAGIVQVNDETGSPVTFTLSGSTWVAPAFNSSTLTSSDATSCGTSSWPWTYTRWNGEVFHFNTLGQVCSESDRNGNTTTFTYNSSNHLTTMTDASSRTLTFTWGTGAEAGNITEITEPSPEDYTVQYAYDTTGTDDLTEVTNQAGGETQYGYNGSNYLTSITDPDGNETTFTYNSSAQVLTEVDPEGNTSGYGGATDNKTTYSYSIPSGEPNETQTLVTDPNGNETQYTYDYGLLIEEIDAYGTILAATTYSFYDPVTMGLSMQIDPDGNTTTYAYSYLDTSDLPGEITAEISPDGNGQNGNVCTPKPSCATAYTTSYTYNALGEVLTETDPNGNVTTNTYNADGDLCWSYQGTSSNNCMSVPSGATSYVYGDSSDPGLPTSETDPDGNTTTMTYDTYGNVLSSTNAAGDETTDTYDHLGRKLTETSPRGNVSGCGCQAEFTTSYTYDPLNDLLSTIGNWSPKASWYQMSEASGTTLDDSSGNGVNGTYGASGITLGATGPFENNPSTAVTSNGTDGLASVDPSGGTNAPFGSSMRTISVWYKTTSTSTMMLYDYGSTTTDEWFAVDLQDGGEQIAFEGDGDNYTFPAFSSTTADGNWHNLVISYDGGTGISMTLDGGTTETGTLSTALSTGGGSELYIGTAASAWSGTSNWDGSMADLYISKNPTDLTSNVYDADGNPIQTTDPDGIVTTNTYDPNGQSTAQTVTNWGPTSPSSGWVTDKTTTTAYDPDGNTCWTLLGASTDGCSTVPSGATSYVYNALNEKTSMTDGIGDLTCYAYDADGNLLTLASPDGNTSSTCNYASHYITTYTYDPSGQVLTTTDPNGNVTTNTYDGDGNVLTSTDGMGDTTTSTYNNLNLPTEAVVTSGSGLTGTRTTYTSYDLDGNTLTTTDGNGSVTTYAYNDAGEQCWEFVGSVGSGDDTCSYNSDDGPSGDTLYSYDPDGNLATTTEPSGDVVTNSYDSEGELTGTSYSDGSTPSVSYSYDPDGNRLSMTDGTGTSVWTYDALGEELTYTDGAGAETQFTYQSNGSGNQTSITYPSGLVVSQGFNAIDQECWTYVGTTSDTCSSNPTGPSGSNAYTYDDNGNLTAEDLANGVENTYSYDYANVMTGIDDTNSSSDTVLSATYTVNPDNLVTSDSSQPSGTQDVKYTGLQQVCYAGSTTGDACSSPPTGADDYGFDDAGNLTTDKGVTQAFTAGDAVCWTYTSTTSDTCSSNPDGPSGATDYSYNSNGDRTEMASTGTTSSYQYNGANEMCWYDNGASSSACSSAPSGAETYTYDGDGLRMSATNTSTSTTTAYAWNDTASVPLLLQETAGSANPTSYVYGPNGLPILEILPSGSSYYYSQDDLGSTRALTDSTGTMVNTDDYDPYGNLISSTGTTQNNILFAGQYLDAASGLYYLRARYYDPVTGQFLTIDPDVESTLLPYAYTADDPVNQADPTGDFLTGGPGDWAISNGRTMTIHSVQTYDSAPSQGWVASEATTTITTITGIGTHHEKTTSTSSTMASIYRPAPPPAKHVSRHKRSSGWSPWAYVAAAVVATAVIAGTVACVASVVCGATVLAYGAAAVSVGGLVADDEAPEIEADFQNTVDDDSGAASNVVQEQCGESFASTTQVELASGQEVAISQLTPGTTVLAADPKTGKTQPEKVLDVMVNHDDDLMNIRVKTTDGTGTIHATAKHLIWDVTTHKWTEAKNLKVGDHLWTGNGVLATVAGTTVVPGSGYMWDLTVSNDHDFFVQVVGTSVLVHNCTNLDPNKLNHIFGDPDHNLSGVVQTLGGESQTIEAAQSSLEGSDIPSEGLFEVTRNIGGQIVTIRGAVVGGIPRIGTMFVAP